MPEHDDNVTDRSAAHGAGTADTAALTERLARIADGIAQVQQQLADLRSVVRSHTRGAGDPPPSAGWTPQPAAQPWSRSA